MDQDKRPARAYLPNPSKRGTDDGGKSKIDPFSRLTRHHVTVKGAQEIENGRLNPLTRQTYSAEYYELQASYRHLPVRNETSRYESSNSVPPAKLTLLGLNSSTPFRTTRFWSSRAALVVERRRKFPSTSYSATCLIDKRSPDGSQSRSPEW